jgi:hypothetical protein
MPTFYTTSLKELLAPQKKLITGLDYALRTITLCELSPCYGLFQSISIGIAMVLTLKKLLLNNESWYRYHQFYSEHGEIRPAVESSINKIISCHHYARGHAHYHCSNASCTHEKRVHFSCKDRGCSSCGKVATDNWLLKQKELLPPCPFQHITFTMPKVLSEFFWLIENYLIDCRY